MTRHPAGLRPASRVGPTQAELAECAGMTQPQLSRLESGGATPTVPLLAEARRSALKQIWTSNSAGTSPWLPDGVLTVSVGTRYGSRSAAV